MIRRGVIIMLACLSAYLSNAQVKPIEQRIDSVMNLMTLNEKVGQMIQINGKSAITGPKTYNPDFEKQLKSGMLGSLLNAVGVEYTRDIQRIAVEETRLGIPLLFGFDVIHGWKTISPIPIAEVVQLYVRDLFGSVTRPVKELKGFEKVMLKIGEEKVVTFKLTSDDLRFYNINMDFIAEAGDFKVFVGGDSNAVLESEFKLIK